MKSFLGIFAVRTDFIIMIEDLSNVIRKSIFDFKPIFLNRITFNFSHTFSNSQKQRLIKLSQALLI